MYSNDVHMVNMLHDPSADCIQFIWIARLDINRGFDNREDCHYHNPIGVAEWDEKEWTGFQGIGKPSGTAEHG